MRPCVAELPRLQAAYATYHDAGFEVVGVSLDETKAAVVDFARARNLPWRQIHNASSGADLVEAFGVSTIPATFLIDPQGVIIRLELRGPALEKALRRPSRTRPPSGSPARRPSEPSTCHRVASRVTDEDAREARRVEAEMAEQDPIRPASRSAGPERARQRGG